MIKIEFPANRPEIARAMSMALRLIAFEGSCAVETGDRPSMSTEDARQLAEDLSTEDVQVSHEDPKQPAPESTGGEPTERSKGTDLGVSAESAFGTAPTAETNSLDLSTSDARADEHGVPFNAAFCGAAKEPYYSTGKMKGQWKKRKGVGQVDYDVWYADELGKLSTPSHPETGVSEPATVNVGAAFGAAPSTPPPSDAPSLMVWVSERQAAGELSQDDVNGAYQATGVTMADLFGDNPESSVVAVHKYLSDKVHA